MTAKIINLNQARKQRLRDEKEVKSAAAREKFGRTKTEKKRDQLKKEKSKSHLDGHQLDNDKNE